MAISINEVKPGVTVILDRNLFRCVDYHHQRSAQQSWIKIKFKNMRSGAIIEKTFKPGEKVENAHIEYRPMQFLYHDDVGYNFMDPANFEQITIPASKMEDAAPYLKEGFLANVTFYGEEVLDVELPASVELKVTETSPGFKGDTVSGGKPATMETGVVVQVPFFVNVGDNLKIDTREGKYLGRA